MGIELNGAEHLASMYVFPKDMLARYSWEYEDLDVHALLGLRWGSIEYAPVYTFSVEDQVSWLKEEIRASRGEWSGLLCDWCPFPEGEDMVLSFEEDENGPYVVVWDGHHRLAACYKRGIQNIRLVIGRRINKE